MKNEEETKLQNQSPSPAGLQSTNSSSHDLFHGINFNCRQNKPTYFYCSEQMCKKGPVVCKQEECECQKDHQNCGSFTKANIFQKRINDKVKRDLIDIVNQIDAEVQKIINRISEMFEEFKEMFKTFGLNKKDEEIIQKIRNPSKKENIFMDNQLTGYSFYDYRESSKSANENWFNYSYEKYQNVLKKTQNELLLIYDSIQNILAFIHTTHKEGRKLKDFFSASKVLLKTNNNEKSALSLFGANSQKPNTQSKNDSLIDNETKYLLETLQTKTEISSFKKIYSYDNSQSDPHSQERLIKVINNKSNLLFLLKNKSHERLAAFVPIKLLREERINRSELNNEKKGSAMIMNLTKFYCDQTIEGESWFIYRQKLHTLEIGQSIERDRLQLANEVKLLIHLDKDCIWAQNLSKQNQTDFSGKPKQRGLFIQNWLNNLTVINLEVYQVEKISKQQTQSSAKNLFGTQCGHNPFLLQGGLFGKSASSIFSSRQ